MPDNPSPDEYLPLLRTQRNEAFEWVLREGFDPSQFEVLEAKWGDTRCTRFAYKDSPYFLDVGTARRQFHVRYSPGASELMTHQMGIGGNWGGVEESFLAWLAYLRREVEAPDLWALYRDGPTLYFPGASAENNEPFSGPEIAQINIGIDEIRVYLIQQGVGGEALVDVNAKLDYLVASSSRQGRFDWANIAFSTLFSIALQVAFDPERARVLFEMLASPFRQLIAGP
jgi:hypothetical protein